MENTGNTISLRKEWSGLVWKSKTSSTEEMLNGWLPMLMEGNGLWGIMASDGKILKRSSAKSSERGWNLKIIRVMKKQKTSGLTNLLENSVDLEFTLLQKLNIAWGKILQMLATQDLCNTIANGTLSLWCVVSGQTKLEFPRTARASSTLSTTQQMLDLTGWFSVRFHRKRLRIISLSALNDI